MLPFLFIQGYIKNNANCPNYQFCQLQMTKKQKILRCFHYCYILFKQNIIITSCGAPTQSAFSVVSQLLQYQWLASMAMFMRADDVNFQLERFHQKT
ncbi:hypothetical protein KS4_02180 [Poriferisphaera corsica]|uniref:Uncharacterized protein n=1 Tax=Poriferisphaera corsica TaxID=2528020 RepID=A0A517YPN9_9BACT|nr:hypothetical protein KS4_02180 [Poriferisphaera corsica]